MLKGVINLLDEKYLTTKEVAQIFGISANTVINLCKSGELPSVRIGAQFRISEKELNNYIKNQNSKGE